MQRRSRSRDSGQEESQYSEEVTEEFPPEVCHWHRVSQGSDKSEVRHLV